MRRIGVMQDVPNGDKRKARESRAAAEREAQAASLAATRATVRRETATAWFDVLYAERTKRELERLVGQVELQRETLAPAITAGRASPADAFALGGAAESVRERLIEQDRAIAKARAQLAALVRGAASAPLGQGPDITRLPQLREQLLAELHGHPEIASYHEKVRVARTEVALERTTKIPDWNVELLYGWRSPNFSNMITLMFSIDLPLAAERRQDRDIAARLAEVEEAEAMAEDARRMHEAEVRIALADWDAAAARLARYDAHALPLARDRAAAALAAYRGGTGPLAGVIDAQRAETEAELGRIGAEAERARAWARLAYLLPEEQKK
jgi:outer membrane protein TolC